MKNKDQTINKRTGRRRKNFWAENITFGPNSPLFFVACHLTRFARKFWLIHQSSLTHKNIYMIIR
jgi:hypothetical protein